MTTYVALLRGIMPTNPNTRNEKLREVFISLGFKHVMTVIGSGNVVFESTLKNSLALENKIEKALFEQLGFKNSVIIRRKGELEFLQKKEPFSKIKEGSQAYLVVTFFKYKPEAGKILPSRSKSYITLGMYSQELCSVLNIEKGTTSDFMRFVEKMYGKEITTRTWKTVGKILEKMTV